MSTVDLDAIRARMEAATQGPWVLTGGGEYVTGIGLLVAPDDGGVSTLDAEFIAHARTDIPALLAEVDRLTTERDQAKQACQTLGSVIEHNGRELVEVTDSQDIIGEDGDGDWQLVSDRLHELKAERDRLNTVVAKVRELHRPAPRSLSSNRPMPTCIECADDYPCPTILALGGVS